MFLSYQMMLLLARIGFEIVRKENNHIMAGGFILLGFFLPTPATSR